MSFWHNLPKPICVLAPMADVTDAPFRRMIAKYSAHRRSNGTIGGPDVMWTEFVSADGLMRANEEGREKMMADLMFDESERPIVAQLFTAHPEYMEQAAILVRELGFDGIDINMGCPDRSIERQGCGSVMIKDPQNAQAVILAAKRGAGDLPVSVKTRVGYTTDILESWLPVLLEVEPAVITIHARTRKEMSKAPAQWSRVTRAVAIRDAIQNDAWQRQFPEKNKTLIFGNGDVVSISDAKQKAYESGADGVMLGRAVFGNPWLFHPNQDANTISINDKLRVMLEHTRLFEEMLPFKNFAIMKKHYKAYVHGFDGAKELRMELMDQPSSEDVEKVVNRFLEETHV